MFCSDSHQKRTENELLRNLKITAVNDPSRSHSILKSFVEDLCFWTIDECESFDGIVKNNNYGRSNRNKKGYVFAKKQSSTTTMKEEIDMTNEEKYFNDVGSGDSMGESTWHSAIDQKSGKIYYYDSITRKTQWNKVGIRYQIKWQIMNNLCSIIFNLLSFIITFSLSRYDTIRYDTSPASQTKSARKKKEKRKKASSSAIFQ